jgi:hypothetical protein
MSDEEDVSEEDVKQGLWSTSIGTRGGVIVSVDPVFAGYVALTGWRKPRVRGVSRSILLAHRVFQQSITYGESVSAIMAARECKQVRRITTIAGDHS